METFGEARNMIIVVKIDDDKIHNNNNNGIDFKECFIIYVVIIH